MVWYHGTYKEIKKINLSHGNKRTDFVSPHFVDLAVPGGYDADNLARRLGFFKVCENALVCAFALILSVDAGFYLAGDGIALCNNLDFL